MSSVSFLRHSGWFAPEDAREPLNIIGVGATGSWIAFLAAKMGFHNFRVWDGDVVEAHNLPNQAYDVSHIGKLKVDALKEVLERFNPQIKVETHPYFFTREHVGELDGPLILTVDTMKARKEVGEVAKLNPMVSRVFETRLGFEYGELNILDNLDPEAMDLWLGNLKRDEDIPDGPCNLQICTTLVTLVASETVHRICEMHVAKRTKDPWEPASKTVFSNPKKLEVYTF